MGGEEQQVSKVKLVCPIKWETEKWFEQRSKRSSPHPPTPSPQKFGLSLIRLATSFVRIYGERGSQFIFRLSFLK